MSLFSQPDPNDMLADLCAGGMPSSEARQLAYACAKPSAGGDEDKRDPGAIVAQGGLPEEEP